MYDATSGRQRQRSELLNQQSTTEGINIMGTRRVGGARNPITDATRRASRIQYN